jgi:hypothetical protein
MLTWIEISPADLTHYLADQPLNLLHDNTTDDPLIPIVADVCAWVVSFVPEPWRRPPSTQSVPIATKRLACALIVEALQSRVPEWRLSEDQVRNAQTARETLVRMAETWKNELAYPNGCPNQGMQVVRFRKNTVNHKTLRGL